MACRVESNSLLVAGSETTSAVSPTRREAPQKDVWNAAPPPSWVHAENTGLTASTINMRCHTKHENGKRSLALLCKHDQAHLEQHSHPPAFAATAPRSMIYIPPPPPIARPPATKCPFLVMMTNQNQISPASHSQNQPPDSGFVHEFQPQQLWLSLHRFRLKVCAVNCQSTTELH